MSRDRFRSLSEDDDTLGGLLPSLWDAIPGTHRLGSDGAGNEDFEPFGAAPAAQELDSIEEERSARQTLDRRAAQRMAARALAEEDAAGLIDEESGEPLIQSERGLNPSAEPLPLSEAAAGDRSHRVGADLAASLPERGSFGDEALRAVPGAHMGAEYLRQYGSGTPEGRAHGLSGLLTLGHQDEILARARNPLDQDGYETDRDRFRRTGDQIEQRDPEGVTQGAVLGMPVMAAVPGGGDLARRQGLGRIATGAAIAAEGGAMGGINASGESDAEMFSPEWRDEVLTGTGMGAGLSALMYGVPTAGAAAVHGLRSLAKGTPEAMARGAARIQEAIGGADEGTAATVGRFVAHADDAPSPAAAAPDGPFGTPRQPAQLPAAGPYRTSGRSLDAAISDAAEANDPVMLASVPGADDARRRMILERSRAVRASAPTGELPIDTPPPQSGTRNIRRPRRVPIEGDAAPAALSAVPTPAPRAPEPPRANGPSMDRVIAASEGRINQLSPRDLRAAAVRGEDPANRDALLGEMSDSLNNLFRLGDEVEESVGRNQVKERTIRSAMERAPAIPEARARAAAVAEQVSQSVQEMAQASGGALSRRQRDELQRLVDVASTSEDPAASFMALDDLKRQIGRLRSAANGGRLGPNSAALADDLEGVYGQLRGHLEDAQVWGQGATRIQREANAAYTPYIPARDALERRFMEPDPHARAVNGWDQAQRANRQRIGGLLDNANAADRLDERGDLLRGAHQFSDWAGTMQRLYAGDTAAAQRMQAEARRMIGLIETMQTDARSADMLRQASEAVGRVGVGRMSLGLPQVVRLLQRYADDPIRAAQQPGGRVVASMMPALSRALRGVPAAGGAMERGRTEAPAAVQAEDLGSEIDSILAGEDLGQSAEPRQYDDDLNAEIDAILAGEDINQ